MGTDFLIQPSQIRDCRVGMSTAIECIWVNICSQFLLSQPGFLQWWTLHAAWRSFPAVWLQDNSSDIAAVICNGNGRLSLDDNVGSWREGKRPVLFHHTWKSFHTVKQNRLKPKTLGTFNQIGQFCFWTKSFRLFPSLTKHPERSTHGPAGRDGFWPLRPVLAWRKKAKTSFLRY